MSERDPKERPLETAAYAALRREAARRAGLCEEHARHLLSQRSDLSIPAEVAATLRLFASAPRDLDAIDKLASGVGDRHDVERALRISTLASALISTAQHELIMASRAEGLGRPCSVPDCTRVAAHEVHSGNVGSRDYPVCDTHACEYVHVNGWRLTSSTDEELAAYVAETYGEDAEVAS